MKIPELTAIMHEINDRMRDFRRRYDPADPKVREAFDKFMDAVKGIFRKGRDLVEMLFEEARSVEQQLDRIAGTLVEKQQQLKRNVVLCDELYKANEAAIGQLIGVIAVMELVRDLAVAEAAAIRIDPADVDRRDKEERLVAGHRVRPGDRGADQRVPAAAVRRLVDLAAGAQHPARCTTGSASGWRCW